MRNTEVLHRYIWAGGLIVALAAAMLCVVICAGEATVIPVQADTRPTEAPIAEIIYTDVPEHEAAPLYPLTLDERDYYAALVAGKAADQPAGCQQAVATVLYHTLLDCGGDMRKAAHDYGWGDVQTPTDDTYDAIDAVFVRGEMLLDADVLWIARAGEPDAFHRGLEEVCTIGGITFYREGK